MPLNHSLVLNHMLGAGIPKENAFAALSSMAANEVSASSAPSSSASALLNQLVSVAADPVAANNTMTLIEQVPGIPSGVVSELAAVRAAGTTPALMSAAIMAALPSLQAGISTMSAPPSILGMTL
jgi:hypothetical protein